MLDKGAIDVSTMFRRLLKETKLNYFFTEDLRDELKYPAFYRTGIHWSRTFEQRVSSKIIKDLNSITNKHYRNLILGDVKKSDKCFWRDCDVEDLLNIWGDITDKYYEYKVKREFPERYDKMRFLLQGDSFTQGFLKDVRDIYPEEQLNFVSRRNYFDTDKRERLFFFKNDYYSLDLEPYIYKSDVIIIEIAEPEILNYSYGFVRHVLEIIDKNDKKNQLTSNANIANDYTYNIENDFGIYPQENSAFWTKGYASFDLKDENIKKRGLEINFSIPKEIIQKHKKDNVKIYVNRKKVLDEIFTTKGVKSVYLKPYEILKNKDDIYNITIKCRKSVLQAKDGKKILGIRVNYIGAKR